MSIEGMRLRVARLLPDSATIERKTAVSDLGGGTTETWANQATGVSCRIEPAGGGETGATADRVNDETSHVVYFAAGTDIAETDRVLIGGQVYEITAVHRWGTSEVYRSVEAKEAA